MLFDQILAVEFLFRKLLCGVLMYELEYYRRLLEPALRRIGTAFLRLAGSSAAVSVEWSNINLQDETEYAQARLWNAQAAQLEQQLENC